MPDPTVQQPNPYAAGPPPGYPPAPSGPPGYAPPGPPPYAPGPAPYLPPGQAKSGGNGCLKAFLIVLAISVVVAIIAVVALFVAANRIVQNTIGTARPEDFELSSDDMTCNVASNRMAVSGTITNTTDHKQEFRISVDFLEGSGGTKLGEATAFSGSLTAGQSTTFRASSAVGRQPSALTCQVVDVSYFGS